MALKADEGLRKGREIHYVEERTGITLDLLEVVVLGIIADFSYGKTARAMTRFAVYQREAILGFYLLAMDTVSEIIGNLIMLVALGDTVVRSHILRIQPADNHPLIFAYRKNGPALLQPGTGYDEQGHQ